MTLQFDMLLAQSSSQFLSRKALKILTYSFFFFCKTRLKEMPFFLKKDMVHDLFNDASLLIHAAVSTFNSYFTDILNDYVLSKNARI